MRTLWSRWCGLLAEREAGTTLALYRIACGVCILLLVGSIAWHGLVPVVWLNPADGGYKPVSTPWLFGWLGGVNPTTVWCIVAFSLVSAVLLILGLGGRLTSFVALQTILALTHIDRPGFDDLLLINMLWLLVLSRSTATLSLDCRRRTGQWTSGELVSAWPRYLVIVQLVVLYWAAGIQKVSVYWTPADGYSALYYILQRPGWVKWEMTWLAWIYPLTQAATALTWLWEVTAPLLLVVLWFRRTADRPGRLRRFCNRLPLRGAFVAVGLAVHTGIFVFMDLGPFSLIIGSCYICLFRPPPGSAGVPSASTSRASRIVPLFVAIHIVAVLLQASPAPMYSDRESWKQPRVQAELAEWATRLDVPEATLEERLWTVSDRYLRVRNPIQEVFSPYYRYCGTAQGWRMFVAPDLEPTRLEIEVLEAGQWRTVYRELDSEYRWLAGTLEHWRFRVAFFSTTWTRNWDEFHAFSQWVAVKAKRDFPDAEGVRIGLTASRVLSAHEVRAGFHSEVKPLHSENFKFNSIP